MPISSIELSIKGAAKLRSENFFFVKSLYLNYPFERATCAIADHIGGANRDTMPAFGSGKTAISCDRETWVYSRAVGNYSLRRQSMERKIVLQNVRLMSLQARY